MKRKKLKCPHCGEEKNETSKKMSVQVHEGFFWDEVNTEAKLLNFRWKENKIGAQNAQ